MNSIIIITAGVTTATHRHLNIPENERQNLERLSSALAWADAITVFCFLLLLGGFFWTLFNIRQLHLSGAKTLSMRPIMVLSLSFLCGWMASILDLAMLFHDFSGTSGAQSCSILAKVSTLALVAHSWLLYGFLYCRAKLVTPQHYLGVLGDILYGGTLCMACGMLVLTVLINGRVLSNDTDTYDNISVSGSGVCVVDARPWLAALLLCGSVLVGIGYIYLFSLPVSKGHYAKFPPAVTEDDAASPLLAGLKKVAKRNLRCTVAMVVTSFAGYTYSVAVANVSQENEDADRLEVLSTVVNLMTMVVLSFVGRMMRGIAVPDTKHHLSLQLARTARIRTAPPRLDLTEADAHQGGSTTTVVPRGIKAIGSTRKPMIHGFIGNANTVSKETVLNFIDPDEKRESEGETGEARSRRSSVFHSEAHKLLRLSFESDKDRGEEEETEIEVEEEEANGNNEQEPSMMVLVGVSDSDTDNDSDAEESASKSTNGETTATTGGHSKQKSSVVVEVFLRDEYKKEAETEKEISDEDNELLVFDDNESIVVGIDDGTVAPFADVM